MTYLYIDFETEVSPTLSLTKMTLVNYLARAGVLSVAWAVDNGDVQCAYYLSPSWAADVAKLKALVEQGATVVAHNASFDVRVLTRKLGIMWPNKIHCTMELAQAWSPNQPGGYGLANLSAVWLPAAMQKAKINLATCTQAELLAYNMQDVVACRALHQLAMAKMHADEIRVHELTQNVKELTFTVDHAKVGAAITAFAAQANQASAAATALLGDGAGFNAEADGAVKSVKPHEVKRLLLENLGFDTQSISAKKLNPEKLRQAPQAAQALEQVAAANKALSNKRRVGAFASSSQIDCELTYFAAHTGRWSSRNSSRGLNLHNLPKRAPKIAKPIRQLFRLPDDLCFVRGDFANVEYRVCALLTGCAYVDAMFTKNPNADPYAEFWTAATGQKIDKAVKADQPKRQLAKAAVLGLSYCMGFQRWTDELARGLSDPTFGVTLADMDAVCTANRWVMPSDPRARAVQTKLRVPWQVVTVAYHTRERFHAVHPEFGRAARWMEATTVRVSGAPDPVYAAAESLRLPGAMKHVGLLCDQTLQGRSLRIRCGFWPTETVTWRDMLVRQTPIGTGLTFIRAGHKPPGRLSVNVAIENVVQSAARNALAMGLLELDRRGYPYVLHVHDEVMIICPRDRESVLKARQTMIDVFAPGGWLSQQGWSWAAIIKPSDICLSATLYEDERISQKHWEQLEAGDTTPFGELP